MLKNGLTLACLFTLPLAACGPTAEVDLAEDALVRSLTYEPAADAEADPDVQSVEADEGSALEAEVAGGCEPIAVNETVLARYDVDGSGTLNEEERTALVDAVRARRDASALQRLRRRPVRRAVQFIYDADESGALDDDERAALQADLLARCDARNARLLTTFDLDGTGDLDAEERAAARADRRARVQQRRADQLATYDLDGSGRLETDERAALRDDREARRRALATEFDADDSGALDAGEKDALREHLRARIRGEDVSA
jgi:hypothetical protein